MSIKPTGMAKQHIFLLQSFNRKKSSFPSTTSQKMTPFTMSGIESHPVLNWVNPLFQDCTSCDGLEHMEEQPHLQLLVPPLIYSEEKSQTILNYKKINSDFVNATLVVGWAPYVFKYKNTQIP